MFEPLPTDSRFASFYHDPRADDAFEPACFPGEDPASVATDDRLEPVKNRFLSVYYRRNHVIKALRGETPDDIERTRLLHLSIELTAAIDALEDACAPFGFLAEPAFDPQLDMFATSVRFTYAIPMSKNPFEHARYASSSFSLYIPLS